MTDTFKKLYQGVLPAAAGVLATVGAGKTWIIKGIALVNTSGADQTAALWDGGTADGNAILPPSTIVAGGMAQFDGVLTLAAASTLQGKAGAATSITITVYGDEVS